ncbi:MAG: deoxyribose-phosphate aldolase [Bacilli bacterium]|nr:deoxyribose-phosphate aldolase [Bacilli bacterium]
MNYNEYIDHTLLKANATHAEILQLCLEAKTHSFASVCINPYWVPTCREALKESEVKVCTVIGFPLGASSTLSKANETRVALEQGADEFDMVINIGALKDKRDDIVLKDIQAVVEAAQGRTVKVIIETCLLSEEEKIRACELCVEAKAHFVKTSTGFSTAGATFEDVALMKKAVNGHCKVKAAGGVRSMEDMQKMIEAGADRIGTSSGVKLVQGLNANSTY